MATIKRTAHTTVQAAPRTLPPLEQSPSRLGDRAPGQLPGVEDNQWPDVPVDPESEAVESQVVTVGQEQLKRSREMQEIGIANWVAARDERDPADRPQQVAGVTPLER
jgi:hypothetical protein